LDNLETVIGSLERLSAELSAADDRVAVRRFAERLKAIAEQMVERSEQLHSHMLHTAAVTSVEVSTRALLSNADARARVKLVADLHDAIDYLRVALQINANASLQRPGE
jgi:hypothetical protein